MNHLLEIREAAFPLGGGVSSLSLCLDEGETRVILGSRESGLEETGRILTGEMTLPEGALLLDGSPAVFSCPTDALRRGCAKSLGVIETLSVRDHIRLLFPGDDGKGDHPLRGGIRGVHRAGAESGGAGRTRARGGSGTPLFGVHKKHPAGPDEDQAGAGGRGGGGAHRSRESRRLSNGGASDALAVLAGGMPQAGGDGIRGSVTGSVRANRLPARSRTQQGCLIGNKQFCRVRSGHSRAARGSFFM